VILDPKTIAFTPLALASFHAACAFDLHRVQRAEISFYIRCEAPRVLSGLLCVVVLIENIPQSWDILEGAGVIGLLANRPMASARP
jgi:hypothetical protein